MVPSPALGALYVHVRMFATMDDAPTLICRPTPNEVLASGGLPATTASSTVAAVASATMVVENCVTVTEPALITAGHVSTPKPCRKLHGPASRTSLHARLT